MNVLIRKFYAPDVEVGAKLTVDATAATQTVKQIKADLKEATGELLIMQQRFGQFSPQAITAAKKVAELKDRIKDANEAARFFTEDGKFLNLKKSVEGLTAGFFSLSGVLSIVGIGGELVSKVVTQVVAELKDLLSTTKEISAEQAAFNVLNEEAAKNYAKERVALDTLKIALENNNTSLEDKHEIVNKLQEQYPDYFKNLKIENGQVLGLAEGYAKVVKMIELKSRATAAASLLAKQEEELLKLGFQFGITTMEEAEKAIDRLRSMDNPLARQIVGIADRVKAQREFFQKVQVEAETELGKSTYTLTDGKKQRIKKETEAEFNYKKLVQEELGREKPITPVSPDTGLTPEDDARFSSMKVLASIQTEFNNDEIYREQQRADALIKISEAEKEAKLNNMMAVSSALSGLSSLLGEQTAAGKVLAIASATIDTYVGANKALAQGGVLGIASAVAVIASGLANVKKIVSVKVPNDKGNSQSATAPLLPQLPQSTSTRLDRDQLNQIGNATVRAFVVERDMSNNQERTRRLNRAARLG